MTRPSGSIALISDASRYAIGSLDEWRSLDPVGEAQSAIGPRLTFHDVAALDLIRYDRLEEVPAVGDYLFDRDSAGELVASLEVIATASATSLKNALLRRVQHLEYEDVLHVVTAPPDGLDPDWSQREPVEFLVSASERRLELHVSAATDDGDEDEIRQEIARLISPMLRRNRARLLGVEIEGEGGGDILWRVSIAPSTRARTVGALVDLGQGLEALLSRVHGRGLDQESVREILRAGMPGLLVGLPEGPWLDAKSQDYDLDSDRGKISIAQDVARFANAETGGIIAVGIRTTKRPSGETISAIAPLPANAHGVSRHLKAIDRRVFPPPDGLSVEQVTVSGGYIVLIDVPSQPEEHKPFLVQGAIASDGRTEGAFISIVRRRGEDSIPISAVAIHATLAAGRALLRRGELPE